MTGYLFGTREVGSRLATRVRVIVGAFAGRKGIVVRVVHDPGCIFVRLNDGPTLPFGRSELQEA